MLSANTLFHFTNSFGKLLGILQNGFKPFYSAEDVSFFFGDGGIGFIPMVCFCDIPLSQTKQHRAQYGGYGIGMSKEWGRQCSLTPVLYLHNNSSILVNQKELFGNVRSLAGNRGHGILLQNVLRFLALCKPYDGILYRERRAIGHVRFYDEREWRFVPFDVIDDISVVIPEQQVMEMESVGIHPESINELPVLKLRPGGKEQDTIKYIIVSDKEEIAPLLEHIRRIASLTDIAESLASKIVTVQSIDEDF